MPDKFRDMPLTFVKHRGLFNYAELMNGLRNWFRDHGYKFHEPKHQWKVPAEGIEVEIKIKGDRKVNEYVKYHIEIFLRVYDMKDVEVVKDGQKVKMQDGKVTVEITGKLELDWQNRFGGNKFLQGLQDFLHQFIIKQDIGDHWEDDLLYKLIALTKFIRITLGQEAV